MTPKTTVNIGFISLVIGLLLLIANIPFGGLLMLIGFILAVIGRMGE